MAWKICSSCKKEIPYGARYWVCSVSTCNRKRTGMVFCSMGCWDSHLPMMRHREAWAEERTAPASAAAVEVKAPPQPQEAMHKDAAPARRVVVPAATSDSEHSLQPPPPEEVLVVASKVKAYIRARSGLNTSASLMERISQHVRSLCDQAIHSARSHERKTVLDRDL